MKSPDEHPIQVSINPNLQFSANNLGPNKGFSLKTSDTEYLIEFLNHPERISKGFQLLISQLMKESNNKEEKKDLSMSYPELDIKNLGFKNMAEFSQLVSNIKIDWEEVKEKPGKNNSTMMNPEEEHKPGESALQKEGPKEMKMEKIIWSSQV